MDMNTVEVLLVEDNEHDAELTIGELKKYNLANQLFHVSDGEEALEFLFASGAYAEQRTMQHFPKLIMLDIQMPKVNGIEVLEALKADERTRTIPVVMLTSSKEDPDIQQCYKLGVNSYIVKPVNFERFADAIKSLGFYWLLLNQAPV
ncbi:MAG TPA: response regulator [Chitinophagaceae bacterium]|nr:response regulator [Chitinophagaceae bacterium]